MAPLDEEDQTMGGDDIDMNGAVILGVYRDGMWNVGFRFPDGREAMASAEDLVSAARLAGYKAAPELISRGSN